MPEITVVITGDISAEDLFRMFFGGQVFNASTYATAYNSCNLGIYNAPPTTPLNMFLPKGS